MFVAAMGAVVLAAGPSMATPNFPGALQAHIGASATPPCSTCHEGGRTGRGTVNTPFGRAMRAHGLVEFNEASLVSALDQLAAEKVDSNGNGVSDIDELRAGGDPNPAAIAGNDDLPVYGCAGRVSSVPSRGGAVPFALLAAVVAVVRRQRRQRRQRTRTP